MPRSPRGNGLKSICRLVRGCLILRIATRTSCMVSDSIQHGLIPMTIHTTEMRAGDSTETLESLLRRTAWEDLRPLQIRGSWNSKQMMWDVVDETTQALKVAPEATDKKRVILLSVPWRKPKWDIPWRKPTRLPMGREPFTEECPGLKPTG
jgi:hypothetical protein